jgi:hypothetical protein
MRGSRIAVLALSAAAALAAADLSENDRALFVAARRGDPAAIHRLVRLGARATARDEHRRTPLHDAAAAGGAAAVRTLLAAGAKVDAATPSGWTPLMDAAKSGRPDAAEALLAAGANPDARDRAAGTVLDVAQQAARDDVVALLRRHGARGGGKSVGDRVCVRPWKGAGFCGTVEAIRGTQYLIDVLRIDGCERGCAPDADCSAGRAVGGPSADAVGLGASVWTAAWCLTHTGIE